MAEKKTATDPTGERPTAEGTRRAANQRADAQRNRARILEAVAAAVRTNSDASVSDIAAEAGMGRMTLYGHFQSRAEILEAALMERLDRGDAVLAAVPLDGDAAEAFERLIESSWMLLDESRTLLLAAQKELPAARIRDMHDASEARMRGLFERGRGDGTFRTDLPVSWMLATTHVVLNGAADEIIAGRLDSDEAPGFINATLLPAFAASASSQWPAVRGSTR